MIFTDDDDHEAHKYTPHDCGAEFGSLPTGTKKTILVNSIGSVEIQVKK